VKEGTSLAGWGVSGISGVSGGFGETALPALSTFYFLLSTIHLSLISYL